MTSTNHSGPVVVFGIDGAAPEVVHDLISKGSLPNMKKLIEEGAWGHLQSTVPPITGPAWVSFMTGTNPGQHGVGDWMVRRSEDYQLAPIDASHVKAPTFWQIAGKQSRRSAVINVPVTYPPRPVNGALVGGILSPRDGSVFTYPADLTEQLLNQVPDYRSHLSSFYVPGNLEPFLKDLGELVECRKQAASWMLKQNRWDFFMAHFMATDWAQHALWHCIDPNHPGYNPEEAEACGDGIRQVYESVDSAIGELLPLLPEDATIILMSDHGFGGLHRYIYLNNWLLQKGYMRLKRDPITQMKYLLFRMGITPANLYALMSKLGLVGRAFGATRKSRYQLLKTFFLSSQNIDWERTRAYSFGNIGQVYLNVKGREPQGIVEPGAEYDALREELIAEMQTMRDPENGNQLIEDIRKREDVYTGPYSEKMADILMLPDGLKTQASGLSEFMSNGVLESSFAYTGGHRMNGLTVLNGPNVQAGKELSHAEIIDLAPTILHLMGVPVPESMDGQVLTEAFGEDYLAANPVTMTDEQFSVDDEGIGLSSEEAKDVTERLRALGYVT